MTTRIAEAADRFVKVGDLNCTIWNGAMPGGRRSS